MNDYKKFKHGDEGTHYACSEMIVKLGSKVGCCGCNNHKCDPDYQKGLILLQPSQPIKDFHCPENCPDQHCKPIHGAPPVSSKQCECIPTEKYGLMWYIHCPIHKKDPSPVSSGDTSKTESLDDSRPTLDQNLDENVPASGDTWEERFEEMVDHWAKTAPEGTTIFPTIKAFIKAELAKQKHTHKEVDYNCPCFMEGFNTADAENGYEAKEMVKAERDSLKEEIREKGERLRYSSVDIYKLVSEGNDLQSWANGFTKAIDELLED